MSTASLENGQERGSVRDEAFFAHSVDEMEGETNVTVSSVTRNQHTPRDGITIPQIRKHAMGFEQAPAFRIHIDQSATDEHIGVEASHEQQRVNGPSKMPKAWGFFAAACLQRIQEGDLVGFDPGSDHAAEKGHGIVGARGSDVGGDDGIPSVDAGAGDAGEDVEGILEMSCERKQADDMVGEGGEPVEAMADHEGVDGPRLGCIFGDGSSEEARVDELSGGDAFGSLHRPGTVPRNRGEKWPKVRILTFYKNKQIRIQGILTLYKNRFRNLDTLQEQIPES
jgi:hypothetical protein